MTDQEAAKARSLIFEYLQLKAKIEHIEAEQGVLKAQLDAVMAQMGVAVFEATDGKAQYVEKHKYAFDVPSIIKVVPEIAAKLKLANEDYNKILVGREVALAAFRTVLGTDRNLVISSPKKAK